ncbi:hypothetical protein [uncultured Nitratireductor sp.]|uniref:hypothetical protein n=1 Tax=uncultured Nitratireductor sp. TaxID=520953 RepID=UPI0025EC1E15|nr:hypothetical protein [uncultured Nitratireductor sp.]
MIALAFAKDIQVDRPLPDQQNIDLGAGIAVFRHFIQQQEDRSVIREGFCRHDAIR